MMLITFSVVFEIIKIFNSFQVSVTAQRLWHVFVALCRRTPSSPPPLRPLLEEYLLSPLPPPNSFQRHQIDYRCLPHRQIAGPSLTIHHQHEDLLYPLPPLTADQQGTTLRVGRPYPLQAPVAEARCLLVGRRLQFPLVGLSLLTNLQRLSCLQQVKTPHHCQLRLSFLYDNIVLHVI